MEPQVLKGFRDYLPEEMLPRQRMIAAIEQVFQRFGFAPMQTPALEYSELLLGKYGAEGDKLLFRFHDNGERDVAMRYDLTVPLARMLGTHRDIIPPFKRYQIGPVWRAEKPARGRFREFVQCDIDTVGVKELAADGEIVSAGIAALLEVLRAHDAPQARATRGGTPAITLRLSNRKLLTGLCTWLGVAEGAPAITLFRTLDKLDKQGEGPVREALARDCGLDAKGVERVFQYLQCPATVSDFGPLRALFGANEAAELGMQELATVIQTVREHGYGEYLALDLSIARGLDYYTSARTHPQHELFRHARDMRHDQCSSSAEFDGEIAVRDGVERVVADIVEAQQRGHLQPVDREGGAGQGSRPKRQPVDPLAAVAQALAVAPEHFDVRQ